MLRNGKKHQHEAPPSAPRIDSSMDPKGVLKLRSFMGTLAYLKSCNDLRTLCTITSATITMLLLLYVHYFTLSELASLGIGATDSACTWGRVSFVTATYICSRGYVDHVVYLKWIPPFYSKAQWLLGFMIHGELDGDDEANSMAAQLPMGSAAAVFKEGVRVRTLGIEQGRSRGNEMAVPQYMKEDVMGRLQQPSLFPVVVIALDVISAIAYYLAIIGLYYLLVPVLLIDATKGLFTVNAVTMIIYLYARWRKFQAYRSPIRTTPIDPQKLHVHINNKRKS